MVPLTAADGTATTTDETVTTKSIKRSLIPPPLIVRGSLTPAYIAWPGSPAAASSE